MNLAEIRKKAQEEKTERPSPISSERTDVTLEESVREAGRGGLPGSTLTASQRPPQSFDPLSVLLAGRMLAAVEEELPEEHAEEGVDDDFQEFLCFRVATELYAINIMEIKEIIKPREVTEVPRVPAFVSGVLSLRGIIIPVIDLHRRLGLEGTSEGPKVRVVVVKKGEEFCGVVVDEVIQVVKIAVPTIEQPPAVLDGIDRDFVQGIGRHEGRMLILLQLGNILDLTLC
ncbi:chemotaxis protein CheW [Geobacter sp. DSM 9736]|uniref:chemotaxis protein CheW n=1 Tax=Geobacter sp. DSM 9736 TaxID=1277350 RepID=UPI000B4FEB23|nr:chemotaxis protein CheW [Geobacter sp. DSM 9736]SNB45090.1 purine-binding chemotaxis protein CheW [Geobacter sp. DSM 9736]